MKFIYYTTEIQIIHNSTGILFSTITLEFFYSNSIFKNFAIFFK